MGIPSRRNGLVLLLAFAAAACATAKPPAPTTWPAPPDKPRIQFVRQLQSPADLPPTTAWQRIRRFFLGDDTSIPIFNPTAVALSPDDQRLYVSLTSTGKVVEIDFASGSMRYTANESGKSPKQPLGIATDAAGNLYVADVAGAKVLVYGPSGGYLRAIGEKQLDRPTGIAVDRRRQILYVSEGGRVENDRHRIEVFSLDGRHVRTMGKRGTQAGEFMFPTFLAVGPDGNLYVSDTLNFRIQIFDPEGALVGFFGQQSESMGGFNKVKGIAFDNAGLMHVADAAASGVQVFNKRQQLLLGYGGPGMEPSLMATPNGIAIDSKNNIYVADLMANRVSQYVLLDTSDTEERSPAGNAAAGAPAAAPPPSAAPAK
ncbi:MAG TPA: SMP-30/gluconolactonase/LRE family protein [Anaeromyxobacter sp.]